MSGSEPALYVDLDDVLSQTTSALTDLHFRRSGRRTRLEDVHSFDLSVSLGLEASEYAAFMRDAHAPEFLTSLLPVSGAAGYLGAWIEQGYRVSVFTGRPPSCESWTRHWLEQHAIPHHSLHMVDKYGHPDWHGGSARAMSLEELAAHRFALAIEDSAPMALFLARRMGTRVLLLDRPWNRTAELDGGGSITRIADLSEVARHLHPAPGTPTFRG